MPPATPPKNPSQNNTPRSALWLWQEIVAAEGRQREEARQRLLAQVLQKLPPYFQAKRVESVYLIGSLLRPGHFYPFSDIDLAVTGLQEDYFALLVELEELLDRRVDVLELERCRFREQIMATGLRII